MIDARTLLDLMSRKDYQPAPLRALADRLNVTDPEERRELEALVNALEADGVIRRRKDALMLARAKSLVTGAIDVKRRGFAFVRPVDTEGPDLFVGPTSLGGALDGDLVLAERLPSRGRGGFSSLDSARVVQVLERKRKRLVGTLHGWRKRWYVVPDGMSFAAEIGLTGNDPGSASEGDKVCVELSPRAAGTLSGRIVQVFGDGSDPSVDVPMIIAQFGLRTEFPREVLAEAERLPDEVTADDVKGRMDLRGRLIVTVDPETAQDFDDAISIEHAHHGWKLGVHIADVSHYVRPGTALWEEAAERTTSIYLPTRTIPMLPEKLSNGLCSLRADEDRLTLSVLMDLDDEGKVLEFKIVRSVIRSARRLTYEQALAAMVGEPTPLAPGVVKLLKDAGKLAALRTEFRRRRGALEIDRPEVELEYDDEGRAVGAHEVARDASHRMIEEFMLLANECVARFGEERERPLIHRVHEPPDPRDLQDLFFFAQSLGISSEVKDQRQAIQAMLERVEGTPLSHAVNLVVLKSMSHAEYLAESRGHYALAADHYCHFTSPIRRFPDLIVHTVLKEFDLEKGRRRHTDWAALLDRYAKRSTDMEVTSERAEREVVKVKLLRFLLNRVGEVMHGVVVGVQEFGAFVELEEVPVDGLISSRQFGGRADYDERRHTLTGPRKRFRLRLGDRVRVTIDKIDLERRQLDLRWMR